jgi:enoyl-CoA hydratase/carnithine racemase
VPGVERVIVERRGAVAWLWMNRPESLNAWDRRMGAEMLSAVRETAADPEVRAAVLTATGRSFCTGLDTRLLHAGEIDTAYFGVWQDVFDALEALDVPLVVAARGHCLGGGLALVLCGDYRLAADDAVLGFSAVRGTVGIPPALTYRLAEVVGAARARRLALFAEYLGATDARDIGLVDAVVPGDRLEAAATELTERVSANSPMAIRETKRLLRGVSHVDVPAAQEAVLEATGRCLDALATDRHG